MIDKKTIQTTLIQAMVKETADSKYPITYSEAQDAIMPDIRKKITTLRLLDIIQKVASL